MHHLPSDMTPACVHSRNTRAKFAAEDSGRARYNNLACGCGPMRLQ